MAKVTLAGTSPLCGHRGQSQQLTDGEDSLPSERWLMGRDCLEQKQPLFPTASRTDRAAAGLFVGFPSLQLLGELKQRLGARPQGALKGMWEELHFFFFSFCLNPVFLLDFIINPSDNSWLNCYLFKQPV